MFRTMLLVVALVATIQSSLMAQNIKTYNGALCKPNTMICALDVEVFNEVSYEYYENENYARVWHGRFTALYSRYKDDRSVVGCYEHGVQSGVWEESGVFYDKQGYLSYNFLNGKLHGDYHFESDDLVIYAMFCDNHLSGRISVVGQNGQFFLSGQFDEDGFACGEWEVKYLDYNRIPFIREYVYDKGQVLSIVEIDDSTGERTTYSDQNGEDRRLLSYSGLDSWFSNKMPLYYLLSRRFVNPFNKASYNDATATINQRVLFQPMISDEIYEEVIVADGSVGFHTVEEGDTFGCLAVGAEGYNTTAVYHTVEAGETFGHIAVKYDTSSKRIQELNPDVDPTRLIIGQKIRVKGNKPLVKEEKTAAEAPASSGEAVYHTVEAGETMGHIAFKYEGATQKSIEALNPDLDPTKLQIGQKIRVK